MSDDETARSAVLEAKRLLTTLSAATGVEVPRPAVVAICTAAAKEFVARKHRGVGGQVRLPDGDSPDDDADATVLRRLVINEFDAWRAASPVPSPSASATPRTPGAGARAIAAQPSPRSLSVNDAGSSGITVLSGVKVAAVQCVKDALDPIYRTGKLTRADYSAIVMKVVKVFVAKFRPSASAAAGAVDSAPLTPSEEGWLRAAAAQDCEAALQAHALVHRTEAAAEAALSRGAASPSSVSLGATPRSGGARNSVPRHSDPSESSLGGSPFEDHLRKLRQLAEEAEGSAATAGTGRSLGHTEPQVTAAVSERAAKRAAVAAEAMALQAQIVALQKQLGDKLAELQSLM